MSVVALGVCLVLGLFVAMIVLLEAGRRLGHRRGAPADEADRVGIAAVDGAVFGLMGLLLAFSFSGALTRWDTRREHIRDEVNAIGTAYLRLDLLPPATQPPIKQAVRDYVDQRVATYSSAWDSEARQLNRAKSEASQVVIWKEALAACGDDPSSSAALLVIPSLNEMFDSATTRDLTAESHAPAVIYIMLVVVVLASSLLAGYGMAGAKSVSRVHMLCYALMVALTVYVTLEIEFPRLGLVRIDSADVAFDQLKQSMK